MSTLDVLTVKLEADIAVFQQQLDRAKAELSTFGAATRPAEQGIAKVGASAIRSTAGLGRMNSAFIALARQATGMSPIIGRLADVFGTFAIGAGPMLPILAGLAAIAGAYAWITREARETAKAAKEAGKAVADAWMERQTQGDIDTINEQKVIGGELDLATRKLDRAKDAHENKAYLQKLTTEKIELEERYDQVTTLLTDRRVGRQKAAAEAEARANQKAAADSSTAWAKAVAEIEANVRAHHATFEGVAMPGLGKNAAEIQGAVFPPGFHTNIDSTSDAIKRLGEQANKTKNSFVGVGNGSVPGGGGGILGGVGESIKSMFDPTMIMSGLATGGISTAISFALPKVTEFGKRILGLGESAAAAAYKFQQAQQQFIQNTRDLLTGLTGTSMEQSFVAMRNQLQQLWTEAAEKGLASTARKGGKDVTSETIAEILRTASSFDDLTRILEEFKYMFSASASGLLEWDLLMQLVKESFKDANEQVRGFADGLQNMPSGWKVNLAEFNATSVAGVSTNPFDKTKRDPVVIRFTVDPAGIFNVVQDQAVRKIRSGGKPAWEVAG